MQLKYPNIIHLFKKIKNLFNLNEPKYIFETKYCLICNKALIKNYGLIFAEENFRCPTNLYCYEVIIFKEYSIQKIRFDDLALEVASTFYLDNRKNYTNIYFNDAESIISLPFINVNSTNILNFKNKIIKLKNFS